MNVQHIRAHVLPQDGTVVNDLALAHHNFFFLSLQIRGFLSRFDNVLPASLAFDKCTACSQVVSHVTV